MNNLKKHPLILLAFGQNVWAQQVSYIAEDDSTATCTNYTEITHLTDGPIGTTGETALGFTSACEPKILPYDCYSITL